MSVIKKRSKHGPLSEKRIGLVAGPEFSDFQAYYLNLYLSELGAEVENLVIGWSQVGWKMTRPATSNVVQGMFGIRLDPIPTMVEGDRYRSRVFRDSNDLNKDILEEFDALIVLGGHSADVLRVEPKVTDLINAAWQKGILVGALECGQMVLMSAKILDGLRVTGYRVVRPFLERMCNFVDKPVVQDKNLITARDSNATPEFVRMIAKYFDPSWCDPVTATLLGKRIVIVAGQDFEDVELCVPAMEFDYRGAEVTLGTFPTPVVSRPPMIGIDVVMGNFGMSVPFQELDDTRYPMRPIADIRLDEFDAIMIPGAFCPWNCLDEGSTVGFCKRAQSSGKVIAAICHGPLVLAAAELVKDRRIAGFAACRDDVLTMGGLYDFSWPAAIDGNIVTGRVPDDVPEFVDAITDSLTGSQLLMNSAPSAFIRKN